MHAYTCSNAECRKVFETRRKSESSQPCCSRACSAHLTTMAKHKRTLTGDSLVSYLKESGESYSRHELSRYYRVDAATMQSVLDDLQESGRIKCAANKQKTLYYVQPDRVMYERYEPEFRPMHGYEAEMRRAANAMVAGR